MGLELAGGVHTSTLRKGMDAPFPTELCPAAECELATTHQRIRVCRLRIRPSLRNSLSVNIAKPLCGRFRRQFVTADHHRGKTVPELSPTTWGQVVWVDQMIRMHHCSCDRRCPKFMYVGGPFLACCPLPRAPDPPHDMSETYVCGSERGLMSFLRIGHLRVGAVAVGQQCRAAGGLRMRRWPPFFGRLGRTWEHDRRAKCEGGETEL